jgi:hypothetical protein
MPIMQRHEYSHFFFSFSHTFSQLKIVSQKCEDREGGLQNGLFGAEVTKRGVARNSTCNNLSQSQSQSHITTDDQSVSESWF